MKKLINTIAQFIANFKRIAWYEIPQKFTGKVAKMFFKAADGTLWEMNAAVVNGEIAKNTVVFQGCLFC